MKLYRVESRIIRVDCDVCEPEWSMWAGWSAWTTYEWAAWQFELCVSPGHDAHVFPRILHGKDFRLVSREGVVVESRSRT